MHLLDGSSSTFHCLLWLWLIVLTVIVGASEKVLHLLGLSHGNCGSRERGWNDIECRS